MEQVLAIVCALQVLTLLGLGWVLCRLQSGPTSISTEINLTQQSSENYADDVDEADWWKQPRPNPDDED